jgi:hypothetical protein
MTNLFASYHFAKTLLLYLQVDRIILLKERYVNWIYLAQNMNQWRTVVSTVVIFGFHKMQ